MTLPNDAPNSTTELKKRRSTRIVQAVPLVVTGVDALGRPFQERTSTLIINCHGCRYQSKHYVLKNMWVVMEIPHAEQGHAPRVVRGRVAWIQRPRTVRQLFQVAVELEIPGNVWSIAFPPEDWFSCPDLPNVSTELPASADDLPDAKEVLGALDAATAEEPAEDMVAEVAKSNVRSFPNAGGESAEPLDEQMGTLLEDARQQIQAAAKEAVQQAMSTESRATIQDWQARLAEAREQLGAEVTRAIESVQKEAEMKARAAHGAAAEALKSELPKWLAPQIEELTREIADQMRKASTAQKAVQEQHAQKTAQAVLSAAHNAEETADKLRATVSQAETLLAVRLEAAAREREALATSSEEMRRKLAETLASVEATWQERLSSSMKTAHEHLQRVIEGSLQGTVEQGAQAVTRQASAVEARIREEAERHVEALATRSAAIARELEEQRRREEQAQGAEAPAARAEQFAARLDTVQQVAIEGFQAQLERILGQHREELKKRSQLVLEETNQRVHSAFSDSGRDAAAHFEEQIRTMVQPHLQGTEEALQRLTGARSLVDGALSVQEGRVRKMTEEAFGGALARFRESLDSAEKQMGQRAEAVVTSRMDDLEKRSSQLQHSTADSLFQSAEWYEKKAQTQMQQALDKGLEQAGAQLRERAGEISSVFATEVDHYSRNFVQHAQTQMEEVLRDAFERSRALFSEAADTTSAAFTDEIQRNARQELDGFGDAVKKSLDESRVQADALRESLGAQMSAEQESFLRRFRESMTTAVEAGVSEAQKQVDGGLQEVLGSWRAMTEQHQEKIRALYGQIGDQSVDQFRGRLENVSNSWMVATVTTLDRQSRDVLDGVAHAAEERLRTTCAQAFANIADTLRERLKEISTSFAPPPASGKPMH
jgi:hypothetical protein